MNKPGDYSGQFPVFLRDRSDYAIPPFYLNFGIINSILNLEAFV